MTEPGKIQIAFSDNLGSLMLDVAFEAPAEGVTALFGPSGCGKTTVLRCIAGLHRARIGNCVIGHDIWQSAEYFRPVYERPIGFVFQEASLFPHLSVQKNLLFGAKDTRGIQSKEFSEIVELLGIDRLLERRPQTLSGGESQRVAIGRALLSEPKLLLMDEPLSALDSITKEEIMPYLERMQATLNIPIFYVSHDINEVERFADHLVLMNEGMVLASGPLSQLQSDPALKLAATSHAAVSLNAKVIAYDEIFNIVRFRVNGAHLNMPAAQMHIGAIKRLKICADDVSLTLEPAGRSTIENQLPAKILEIKTMEPAQILIVLGLGSDGEGDRILARITRRSWTTLGLAIGQSVFAQVKAVALVRRSG
jgi:molybdate transport system ATP-binding protein